MVEPGDVVGVIAPGTEPLGEILDGARLDELAASFTANNLRRSPTWKNTDTSCATGSRTSVITSHGSSVVGGRSLAMYWAATT